MIVTVCKTKHRSLPQCNVVTLCFFHTTYERGPCVKSNALPAIPASNFEPGNNMCFMVRQWVCTYGQHPEQQPEQQLDKAPRGKNGEKKSEEQLMLDKTPQVKRSEWHQGKKFMKGCGSYDSACLSSERARFPRATTLQILWHRSHNCGDKHA